MGRILKLLDDNYIRLVIVPAKLYDRLQPLDVSVNKFVKEYLRKEAIISPVSIQMSRCKLVHVYV